VVFDDIYFLSAQGALHKRPDAGISQQRFEAVQLRGGVVEAGDHANGFAAGSHEDLLASKVPTRWCCRTPEWACLIGGREYASSVGSEGEVMRFLRCCSVMDRIPASFLSVQWRGGPLVSVLLLVAVLVGCSTPPRDGRAIDLGSIVIGSTSRDTIIQKLGPPSASLESGGILTYRIADTPEPNGHYVIPRYPMAGWARVKYSLVLTFDAQGLLDQCSFVEVKKE
jgi:hypothetical protein